MIEITVLGTSGATPTRERNLSGIALVHEGDVLLFDCGEGTQMQILKFGVNSSKIRAIFVSHAHGDHIIGIAGLIRTLALNGRTQPLCIFVPKGYESVIKSLIVFDNALIAYQIMVKGVQAGEIYKGKDYAVSAYRVSHSIPTYGYVFKVNDRRKFNEKKAKQLGMRGSMFTELQQKGRMRIGKRIITLKEVTTLQVGSKIVYAADTRPINGTITAAKNADLLIHESTYAQGEAQLARERGHSTAEEAATMAKKAHVSKLLLTHVSARYKRTEMMESEAKRIFAATTFAKDGDKIFI